ncbi:hypothetical protein Turpa_0528 [Turneriella parva DSM 21527]|uniref:Uncharacterized protein n=1 Tax=Turneriella parva (strain ATCC BAA-1111 / DSM 21527 / NCTC 11395 / H) TaxID=869212 RepID=I4B1M5_TURPD|nr:hypothetical protein Turpa_0528 [Turneriella parva DSM 21527]
MGVSLNSRQKTKETPVKGVSTDCGRWRIALRNEISSVSAEVVEFTINSHHDKTVETPFMGVSLN